MKNYISAAIFAIAIVLAAVFLGSAWKKSHPTHESIAVTGSANQNFTSDLIVWNAWFTEKEIDLEAAYSKLKHDQDFVRQYLIGKGVASEQIVFTSVNIQKKSKRVYDAATKSTSDVFDGYELSQNVTIQSPDVDKIEQISRGVSELITQNIEIHSQDPSFYYTKLADLKIKLLAAATADARNRAEHIAQNAGATLGTLRNASMGIFQITGQNSNEEFSGGGAYNTSSKAKTASITVRLEYTVD